jgi:SagB-type dehydrogenase family enzyme
MRYRAAQTLTIHPSNGRFLVMNFLTRTAFSTNSTVLLVLEAFRNWQSAAEIFPEKSRASVQREIEKLANLGALLRENDAFLALEEAYFAQWEWTISAGVFHFGLHDATYQPPQATVDAQKNRARSDPSPPLYLAHEAPNPLPSPTENALNRLFLARRTCREAAKRPITLAQVSDCLFAGLGLVGEVEMENGPLPLKTTPSGGARNPFEAYVFARNVDGLEPGIYHYSAKQHSLRCLRPGPATVSNLLGNQDWVESMPCIVFLVAFLERTMWKYSDANAYRVVLIEAGHIGQNIMLAATETGLSACPTAALAHSAIKDLLGLTRLTHAPLYALTLSYPAG